MLNLSSVFWKCYYIIVFARVVMVIKLRMARWSCGSSSHLSCWVMFLTGSSAHTPKTGSLSPLNNKLSVKPILNVSPHVLITNSLLWWKYCFVSQSVFVGCFIRNTFEIDHSLSLPGLGLIRPGGFIIHPGYMFCNEMYPELKCISLTLCSWFSLQRAKMSDFDRYKVMKAKRMVSATETHHLLSKSDK